MHRPTVGLIAAVLLVAAVVLTIRPLAWDGNEGLVGACVRIGIVMAAVWLAHPQLYRLPSWLMALIVGGALIVAFKPKSAFYLIPLLVAYLVLRPRKGRNGPS